MATFSVCAACVSGCVSGLPKAAVVNQNRLLTALAVLSSNGVTASDVIYLNLPLYHTAGFFIGFIGSIETGETTEIHLRVEPEAKCKGCKSGRMYTL